MLASGIFYCYRAYTISARNGSLDCYKAEGDTVQQQRVMLQSRRTEGNKEDGNRADNPHRLQNGTRHPAVSSNAKTARLEQTALPEECDFAHNALHASYTKLL